MYQPNPDILNKYAHVLVNFALNSGQGIKPNEIVFIQVPESAKPILLPLQNAVLKAGAHPIIQYLPDGVMKDFFTHANLNQRQFFPEVFLKGKVDQADHMLTIIAETDLHELEGVDPRFIMEHQTARKPYMDWRNAKENQGKFTWTLGLYATPAMAKEAGLSLKSCWGQIIKACYLDQPDPKQSWIKAQTLINQTKDKLNQLPITQLHLQSQNTDLYIKIDQNRRWLGGDGRNIPSFEVFISPDWRGTNGHIFFDQPLYRHGNLINNIFLDFKDGQVIKSSAEIGEKVLKEMISVKNADKIGEFSLTDKRLSKINKFMAETLYDENFGGKYGNTHLALGMAYQESYPGDLSQNYSRAMEHHGLQRFRHPHRHHLHLPSHRHRQTIQWPRDNNISKWSFFSLTYN
jgi:aminopeptidase